MCGNLTLTVTESLEPTVPDLVPALNQIRLKFSLPISAGQKASVPSSRRKLLSLQTLYPYFRRRWDSKGHRYEKVHGYEKVVRESSDKP